MPNNEMGRTVVDVASTTGNFFIKSALVVMTVVERDKDKIGANLTAAIVGESMVIKVGCGGVAILASLGCLLGLAWLEASQLLHTPQRPCPPACTPIADVTPRVLPTRMPEPPYPGMLVTPAP